MKHQSNKDEEKMNQLLSSVEKVFNGQEEFKKNRTVGNMRNIISSTILKSPTVELIGMDEEGDIHFRIPREEFGIENELFLKYKKELFSTPVTNCLGELLVRENVDMFSNFLVGIDSEKYISLVNKWSYKKFGMQFTKDFVYFEFHSSLLQNILMEDIKCV